MVHKFFGGVHPKGHKALTSQQAVQEFPEPDVLVIPMAFFLAWLGGLTGLWCAVAVTEAMVAALGWVLWSAARG